MIEENAILITIPSKVERLPQNRDAEIQKRDALLKKRAEKLAQREIKEDSGEQIEVVEFRLDDEHFGLECDFVREVFPLKNLTFIPGIPEFILGIVSIRGNIISVVDLKIFFEIPPKAPAEFIQIIILHDPESGMSFGVLAEEILGSVSIPVRELHLPQPAVTGIRAEYVKGVSKHRLIVLDAFKLLTAQRMIVHQDAEI